MTLKSIAGIVTPDEGRILLNGRTLFDSEKKINLKPRDRKVGYLFQDYALFPNMTVRQNISCAVRGKDKERMAEEQIQNFQLEGLEDQYPHQLSGGQKQRTALARMMANEPEALLLDEPFSALDYYLKEQLQVQMLDFLKDCKKDMILVTHNRDEVYRLCGDPLIMDGGEKIRMGPTKEIFRYPGCVAAARLTGCKNFSRARKLDDTHVEALDWGIVLTAGKQVPDAVSSVGIRAHYFIACQDDSRENTFPAELVETVESPFEMNVVIRKKGMPGHDRREQIWWKMAKEKWAGMEGKVPEFLRVSRRMCCFSQTGREAGQQKIIDNRTITA
ncbi:ATP-binding cassette domain-containing protein [Blautia sp. RD014234]|nr:ATP-binding cassette domain-containing protein [Blautia parvula]